MNSRQRVLTTIRHEEPDRVPIGEWGIDHDHVSRILGRHTYWRNRKGTTLALWAGLNCETLVSGSRAQLEREAREGLKVGMPGGGSIFGANNSVQFGANTDNYLRALELVREHGRYGAS